MCFGGQYTAAIAMSLNGPLTCMEVAWISASVKFCSSQYAIVDFMRIAVPPMGCSVGVIGRAEVISGDDEVGFSGEVRLINEEDFNMVKI